MKKTKIYFAGPLFSESEKIFNEKIVQVLEENGYKVFFPQRDGFEASAMEGKSEEEKNECIFKKDIAEINNADILFMIIDGRVPDDGTCVELGYAYAQGKKCYGLLSDDRWFMNDLKLNPMLTGCFEKIFKYSYNPKTKDETAEKVLKNYLLNNQL